jgi:hypothetical protein
VDDCGDARLVFAAGLLGEPGALAAAIDFGALHCEQAGCMRQATCIVLSQALTSLLHAALLVFCNLRACAADVPACYLSFYVRLQCECIHQ